MKKQFFASAATFTLIAALFTAGCERTKKTDDMPQPTPEPVEIPADITPVAPDTLSTFVIDSIAKADSVLNALKIDSAKAATTGSTAKNKTAAAVQSKKTTKKTTTKTTTTTTGGAETSTQKKGTGTTSTTGGSSSETSTRKKGTNP